MPLPPPPERELLHTRHIEMRGYRRGDGLYEIEGRVCDVRTLPLHPPGRDTPQAAGTPVHDMSVRLVIDDTLCVHDVIAVTDAGPYEACPHGANALQSLRGAQIARGWTARVKSLLGPGACTHLVELLIPLGTAAFQSLASVRLARPPALDANGRPQKIDSCYAYASDGQLVRKLWPQFATGESTTSTAPRT